MLTADLLQRAAGCARGVALTWAKPLAEACAMFDIAAPARLAAFLATVGHESAGLTRTVENLSYSAEALLRTWPRRYTPELAREHARHPELIANHVYGGRMGNSAPGDGWKYRGRGPGMVTGRANYEAMRDLLRQRVPNAPDFVAEPGALAEPRWGAYAFAAFWEDRGLNELADAGDFIRICRRVNGGDIGMEDRMRRYALAKRALC